MANTLETTTGTLPRMTYDEMAEAIRTVPDGMRLAQSAWIRGRLIVHEGDAYAVAVEMNSEGITCPDSGEAWTPDEILAMGKETQDRFGWLVDGEKPI